LGRGVPPGAACGGGPGENLALLWECIRPWASSFELRPAPPRGSLCATTGGGCHTGVSAITSLTNAVPAC